MTPSACWIALADAGIASSGVQVQSSTRSRSAPVTPARAMARSDASMARPVVVPPTRRSRIPVRSMIHSSLVSSVSSRSTLVTTLSGIATPQPVMRALPVVTPTILQDEAAVRQREDGVHGAVTRCGATRPAGSG